MGQTHRRRNRNRRRRRTGSAGVRVHFLSAGVAQLGLGFGSPALPGRTAQPGPGGVTHSAYITFIQTCRPATFRSSLM